MGIGLVPGTETMVVVVSWGGSLCGLNAKGAVRSRAEHGIGRGGGGGWGRRKKGACGRGPPKMLTMVEKNNNSINV